MFYQKRLKKKSRKTIEDKVSVPEGGGEAAKSAFGLSFPAMPTVFKNASLKRDNKEVKKINKKDCGGV